MSFAKKTVLIIISNVCLVFTMQNANTQYLNPIWQTVDNGTYLGNSNIWCADIDEDQIEEIIFGGGGSVNQHFSILKYRHNDYITTYTSRLFGSNYIRLIEIANLDQDGDYEIYVILNSGQIEIYDGSTMGLIKTFNSQAVSATSCSIADVDNDGEIEFTIVTSNRLYIFNSNNFTVEWDTLAYKNNDVQVGDVDNDGENEIVLSDGYVLDGKTHSIEWFYFGSFGDEIELADINQDSVLEIIGKDDQKFVTAFDGEFHTPLWQINIDKSLDAFYVTDLEDDGKIEILVGEFDLQGKIHCYSASTQQLLWQINNPGRGITRIITGDPDQDGIMELIWGAVPYYSGPNILSIASTKLHQIEWQSLDLDGPFSVDVFDLDNNGVPEIIAASNASNDHDDAGMVLVYDGLTHRLLWSQELSTSYDNRNINCIAAGNINDTDQGEIVAGVGKKVYVLDGLTRQILWESTQSDIVSTIELADVDNDKAVELIAGDKTGYITIYNGETFQREWQSVDTGDEIGGITITNCDQDDAPEIVFFNEGGIIQIYDGKTHHLEWQSVTISKVTALDVSDLELNGDKEIIAGHSNGKLTIIDATTLTVDSLISTGTEAIYSLAVANLDSMAGNEILVGTSILRVLDANDFTNKWESLALGSKIGDSGNLLVTDIDSDQLMDVFWGSSWGVFQFECSTPYPDITPPVVVSHSPTDGLKLVGIDTDIKASFSEAIAEQTLTGETVIIFTQDGDTVNTSIRYDETTYTAVVTPDSYLPSNNLITVVLKADIFDPSVNGLDGNSNGISDGSPSDDFSWSFTTGAWVDTVGPSVVTAMITPDSVWQGIEVKITAMISDSSPVAISPVVYAECFVDSIGDFGAGIRLDPIDKEFDAVVEEVKLTLDTDGWWGGNHTIYIHGKDGNDNWGKFVELTVHIISEMAANWPMFGQNAQHTGFNESDSIIIPLQLKWKKKISANPLNEVTVANDLIFVSNYVYFNDAIITAINVKDGSEVWDYSFGAIHSINPPSFAYGYVYIQTCNHTPGTYLTAFDALTGQLVWQSPFSAQWERYKAPTIADGKIFINGGYYGGMYAFDAFAGQQLWFINLPQEDNWTPAYANGVVYACFSGSSYYAVNSETGQLLYRFGDPGYSGHTPVIHNDKIFTVDPISAVDLKTQQIIWSKSGKYTPAVGYNLVFSITSSGVLNVYDEDTGTTLWSFTGDGKLNHTPVLANGYVFVSSDTNTFAVNIQTRQEEWNYNAGGHLTVANNHLYIASNSGELYAFERAPSNVADYNGYHVPTYYALYQNYPNPFNPSTAIQYSLPDAGHVELKIYNLLGEVVETLVDHNQLPGYYKFQWHPQNLTSGTYFYMLKAGDFIDTKKAILMK